MDLKSLPKKVLDLFPRWSYQCPNCGKQYPEAVQVCTQCGTQYNESKWRVPPRFLKNYDTMSEYAHKVLAPKLDSKQRELLFQYFTEFFNDGFESGDFSAWSTHGSPTVQSSIVHSGSYALSGSTSGDCVDKSFTGQSLVYCRFYVRWSTNPANGENFSFAIARASDDTFLLQFGVANDGGTIKWAYSIGAGWNNVASPNPTVDTWYCFEFCWEQNTSNGEFWVDGSSIISGITCSNNACGLLRVGNVYLTSGTNTFYIDSVVVADTYIGPDLFFKDGFESGNFDEWTTTSGSPSCQSSVTHCGTYALSASVNGYSVTKEFTAQTSAYCRLYVRWTDNPSNGEYFTFAHIRAADNTHLQQFAVTNDSGTIKWAYYDTTWNTANTPNPTVDTWYCFEVHWEQNTSNGEIWVDGNSIISSISCSDNDCGKLLVGCIYLTSGTNTFYIDCAVVADTYIGPDPLFDDGFETDSLVKWTGSSVSPDVQDSVAHHGTYAVQFDANGESCYKNLPGDYTEVYARAYIYFNTLPATGEVAYISTFMKDGTYRMRTGVYNNSGTMQIVITDIEWVTSNYAFDTEQWYCWEIKWDSDADDYGVFINGEREITSSATSSDDVNRINLGFIGGWTNQDIIVDCVVVDDEYIGPEIPELPFSDGFESGNFSAWTDKMGSPTIAATPTHHGDYSVLINNDNERLYKDFVATDPVYCRAYVYFSSINVASGHYIRFLGLYNTNSYGVSAEVYHNGTDYYFTMHNEYYGNRTYGDKPSLDTWYCVELKMDKGSQIEMWVDGSSIGTGTAMPNGEPSVSQMRVGIRETYGVSNYYVDCVAVADAYIGPEAAELPFSDGFEDNTFDAWTNTVDSPTIVGSPVYDGSYAAKLDYTTGGTPSHQFYITVDEQTEAHSRFYFRAAALPTTNYYTAAVCYLKNSSGGNIAYLCVYHSEGSTYQWRLYYLNGASESNVIFGSLSADTWYCIELSSVIDGSSGAHRLWIDGDLEQEFTGLDTDDRGNIDEIRFGGQYLEQAIWLIDCVLADDEYIGPEDDELSFNDGFESSDFSAWTDTDGSPSVQGAVTYQGSNAMLSAASGDTAYFDYTATDTVYLRAYVRMTAFTAGVCRFLEIRSGQYSWVLQAEVNNATGNLYLRRVAPTTQSIDSEEVLDVDTWYCVEISWYRHASAGWNKLWLNGELVVDDSGVDTASGTADSERVIVGQSYSSMTTDVYIDSVVAAETYIEPEEEEPELPFTDGFEDNTFDAWTDTVDTPTIVGSPVYDGSYAAKLDYTTGGTPSHQFYKTFDAQTESYCRFYFRAAALPTSYYYTAPICYLKNSSGGNIASINVYHSDTLYHWRLTYLNGASESNQNFGLVFADTWYCVEISSVVDGSSGAHRVWINGELGQEFTSLDTDDRGNIDEIRFGGQSLEQAIWLIDGVSLADEYIGPEAVEIPFNDGFESGNVNSWGGKYLSGGATIDASTDVAKEGTYSAKAIDLEQIADQAYVHSFMAGRSECYLRFYIRFPVVFNANSAQRFAGLKSQNGWVAHVTRNQNSGKWGIYNSVNLAHYYESETTEVSADQWYCVELHVVADGSSGALELWVDGTQKISESGINTGTDNLTLFAVGGELSAAESASRTVYIDNVVVADTYIGPAAEPALRFVDDFESGTLDKWDSTVETAPVVVSDYSHHGSFSMRCSDDPLESGHSSWAYKDFPDSPSVFARAYMRIETVPTSGSLGGDASEANLSISGSGSYGGSVSMVWDSSQSIFTFRYRNDKTPSTYFSDIEIQADTWYCVEINVVKSGNGSWWINGELQDNNIGNNDNLALNRLTIGGKNVGAATTYIWFDCVSVDDTYIGPETDVNNLFVNQELALPSNDLPLLDIFESVDAIYGWDASFLNADAPIGSGEFPDKSVDVENGGLFSVGDRVVIRDDNQWEFCTIASINDNTLVMEVALSGQYKVAKNGLVENWCAAGYILPDNLMQFGHGPYETNMFLTLVEGPGGNSPILAVDQGMVVKKDFTVGGFLGTNQGEVWIGHGRHTSRDQPTIRLTHGGSQIKGTAEQGSKRILLVSNFGFSVGDSVLVADNVNSEVKIVKELFKDDGNEGIDVTTDLSHEYTEANGYVHNYDTLYIKRVDGTPANVDLDTLIAHGALKCTTNPEKATGGGSISIGHGFDNPSYPPNIRLAETDLINLVSYSQAFNENYWIGYCGSKTNITQDTSDVLAPDGTQTACKIVCDEYAGVTCFGGECWGLYSSPVNLANGETYTVSVWLKGTYVYPQTPDRVTIGVVDSTGFYYDFVLTTSWKRYTFTHTFQEGGENRKGLMFFSTLPGRTFYAWGAQIEKGSEARSYVPTTDGPSSPFDTLYLQNADGSVSANLNLGTLNCDLIAYADGKTRLARMADGVVAVQSFVDDTWFAGTLDASNVFVDHIMSLSGEGIFAVDVLRLHCNSPQLSNAQMVKEVYWFEDGVFSPVEPPTGTDFPGSPSPGDLFNRTDEGLFYQYDGSTWVNLGSNLGKLPTGLSPLQLKDNESNNFANIFLTISSDNYDAPIITTDQSVLVKKDISAGGFLGSNQGAVMLGSGLTSQVDDPKIMLMNSAVSRLQGGGPLGLPAVPSGPSLPGGVNGKLFVLTTDQHLYKHNGTTWVDIGPTSDYAGNFDTLHITQSDGSTLANLNLANLTVNNVAKLPCNSPQLSNEQMVKEVYWFEDGKFSPVEPPTGTDFPGSPTTGDLFNRTDEGLFYQYDGSDWINLGSNLGKLPTGLSTLQFKDNESNNFLNLFMTISSDNNNAPILTTDQSMLVKKDISAGGFLGSSQGAVMLGSGLTSQVDNPKIMLTNSAVSRLGGGGPLNLPAVPSGSSLPGGESGQLFVLTTNNHLYKHNGTTWVDIGPTSDYAGNFDTLHITQSDGSTPANLNLGTLTATQVNAGTIKDADGQTYVWNLENMPNQGAEGKVLTAQGAGNPPIWDDAGSGGISWGEFEHSIIPDDQVACNLGAAAAGNAWTNIYGENMFTETLVANEHVHLTNSSSLITRQTLLDHLYKVGDTPDTFNWATIPQYLRFYNQTTGISAYMFCPSLSDGYNEPVLFWDRALAVRKDIITGGRLDSMEGVVSLLGGVGWGPDGYNSNPFIWLVGNQHGYPSKDTLEIRTSTYSGGWIWSWGNIASGNITPGADDTYNLGSDTVAWHDIYSSYGHIEELTANKVINTTSELLLDSPIAIRTLRKLRINPEVDHPVLELRKNGEQRVFLGHNGTNTYLFSHMGNLLLGSDDTNTTVISGNLSVNGSLSGSFSIPWANITDKPSSYTPSAHGLGSSSHNPTTLSVLNSKITDATLDTTGTPRPPTGHSHNLSNVTFNGNFVPALNNTYDIGSLVNVIRTVYFGHAAGGTLHLSGDLKAISIYPYDNGTGYVGTSTYRYAVGYINKLHGSMGDPEPLCTPLNGLADLKTVKFRSDGIPIEKTLPTHFNRDDIKKRITAEKGREPTETEIDAVESISDETVNINHTIGWVIQCISQLSEQIENMQTELSKLKNQKEVA